MVAVEEVFEYLRIGFAGPFLKRDDNTIEIVIDRLPLLSECEVDPMVVHDGVGVGKYE